MFSILHSPSWGGNAQTLYVMSVKCFMQQSSKQIHPKNLDLDF